MAKRGKAYRADLSKIDRSKRYTLEEALALIDGFHVRKFDESLEVAVRLGVDPRQSDQMVRGAVVLPHGVGKKVRVVAIVRGEAEKDARDAGADFVGCDDLIEKISKGWLDFDRVLTTPEVLKELGKIAKVLGPKGLMPNKKSGTVTTEVGQSVKEQKLGTVSYKVEKGAIVHAMLGKKSFGPQKLKDNFLTFYNHLLRAKPPTAKGVYIRKVALSTTMGPGIYLDPVSLETLAKGA